MFLMIFSSIGSLWEDRRSIKWFRPLLLTCTERREERRWRGREGGREDGEEGRRAGRQMTNQGDKRKEEL